MTYRLARLICDGKLAEILPFEYEEERRALTVSKYCFKVNYQVVSVLTMKIDDLDKCYLCHCDGWGKVTLHLTLADAVAELLRNNNMGWIEECDGDCVFTESI